MKILWGIDLGGTKIEGIVIDEPSKKILARKRVPTEGDKGYDHVISQVDLLINMLKVETGLIPNRIGMGTPGTMDPILKVMKNCNSTSLNGRNLEGDLSNRLGYNFVLSNDANCFAIAESKLGVIPEMMPQAEVVFGVILGTGVGGGIVVNDRIIGGRQGIGGEWGHNFLNAEGGKCYCGKIGCVETMISGPALEKHYYSISGSRKFLKEIAISARQKEDIHAVQTINTLIKNFGLAISVVINIIDPDAIVIGGGVGNIDEIYTLGVEEVKKHVFNHRLDTQFFKPKLGDSAGVFGAAFL